MTKSKTNPRVDFFFNKTGRWQEEFEALRMIILSCKPALSEELKWGQACYTLEGKNIVLMHGFKEYCALLFFKGVLLKDPKRILIQQTEHVQAARQIRFTSVGQIMKLKPVLKAYIEEAIKVEKAGLKVKLKKTTDFKVPAEFQNRLAESPILKKAFDALTPGRQRAYIFYFSQPKQSKTREARVEKSVQRILAGKGLDDD